MGTVKKMGPGLERGQQVFGGFKQPISQTNIFQIVLHEPLRLENKPFSDLSRWLQNMHDCRRSARRPYLLQQFQDTRLTRHNALQQNMNDSAAAKPVLPGDFAFGSSVIAPDNRTSLGQPPGFLHKVIFETTTADRACPLAATSQQQARSA